jgi:hypothetical protein
MKVSNKLKRERGGASILCPQCERPTRVLQTRRNDDGTVRRERTCLSCSVVFDTNEKRLRTATGTQQGQVWFPLGSVGRP